jgi:lipoprotein NlpI
MNIVRWVPLLAVGTVAAAFLNLALLFVPVGLGAQTPSPDPCWETSETADQKIAACSARLSSGTLSATATVVAYRFRAGAYYSKGQYDLAIADYTVAIKTYPEEPPVPPNSGYYVISGLAITHNSRGDAYRANGQQDLAIADYTAALLIQPRYVPPYTGRGLALFELGRFGEAAQNFRRRADLSPPYAYSILWFHIARLRSGESVRDLAARSAGVDATKWPGPIFGLYLGRLTPEQALSAATSADDRCEAAFYIAEWRLWHQEVAAARGGFAAALETCPHGFSEYEGARAELARLPK